jgi:hypothetical protein
MKAAKSFAAQPNDWMPTPGKLLVAAGNSQGTALAIPTGQDLSIFTTVAASTGCVLPTGLTIGEEYQVVNHGANALSVYPSGSGQIGTLGASAAYSLAAGKMAIFVYVDANRWASCP